MKNQTVSSKTTIFFGKHACVAALKNNKRKIRKIYVTDKNARILPYNTKHPTPKIMQMKDFDKILPKDSVHQGIAIETESLANIDIKSIDLNGVIIILDQVTDPHNVGAIIRSCVAFGASAIIMSKDHAPFESGTLAKSASGALEEIPVCKVTNLARTMDYLKKSGYWIAGMDGKAKITLDKANLSEKTAIVMGAEGKGLRDLTRKSCDLLIKLNITDQVESLNVSNAAAIALYEITK